jgi:hypothetical protein
VEVVFAIHPGSHSCTTGATLAATGLNLTLLRATHLAAPCTTCYPSQSAATSYQPDAAAAAIVTVGCSLASWSPHPPPQTYVSMCLSPPPCPSNFASSSSSPKPHYRRCLLLLLCGLLFAWYCPLRLHLPHCCFSSICPIAPAAAAAAISIQPAPSSLQLLLLPADLQRHAPWPRRHSNTFEV